MWQNRKWKYLICNANGFTSSILDIDTQYRSIDITFVMKPSDLIAFISLIRRVDCIYMEGIDFMWFWRLVNSSWSNQFSYGFDKCSQRKNCIGISLANMFCGWKRQSFHFLNLTIGDFCMCVFVYFGVVSSNVIKALFKKRYQCNSKFKYLNISSTNDVLIIPYMEWFWIICYHKKPCKDFNKYMHLILLLVIQT